MQEFDATLLEFIKDYGSYGTLTQETEGEYNPSTGEVNSTTVEIPIRGILMDLTLQSNGLSVKYGTLVEAGDKELYMQPPHKTNGYPTPVVISPAADRIEFGGIVYKIVTSKELNPTGTNPVLISLYLRR